MSKINKNLIFYALILFGILAIIVLATVPTKTLAWNGYGFESEGTIYTYDNSGSDSFYGNENPIPTITALSTYSASSGSSAKIITVTGKNFIPSSTVKWNGNDRPTSYLSSTKLLVSVSSNDLKKIGENLVSVMNPAPGGGYSNVAVFTVTKGSQGASLNRTSDAGTIRGESNDEEYNNSLGANAYGSGFLPRTFVQWLMLAILILLIVIIWRKIYTKNHNNHAPLKHA